MIPVAVRMPNWLGDVVMATPVLELLHASKKYETHLLVRRPWVGLFRTDPRIFRVVDCADGLMDIPLTAGELRGRCTAAIDLTHSFRSRLLMFAAGVRRVVREQTQDRDAHQVDRYVSVAREFDGGLPSAAPFPRLYPQSAPAAESGRVAIFPGSAYGPAKQWSEEAWAELIRLLAVRGGSPCLFGTRREADLITRLAASGAAEAALDMPLDELMVELKRCSAAVACDSGPAHLAAALSVPVVSLFLSTAPERTAPRGRAVSCLVADVDCRPCFQRTCRIGYICRPRITPEMVAAEVEKLVGMR